MSHIIYTRKIIPSTERKIKESLAFIATVTKNFVKDKKCREECCIAEKLNKVMYAIVSEGVDWDEIKAEFPWRKIYSLSKNSPDEIMKMIKRDLAFIDSVGV